ncbi:MAG TPA: PhnD/SsuA/transferrin family substrate-binding protein [Aliidongia sp.]|uniref:phosphate/phosphite/phosphonate ABC transporter substrate-binding protein n=1 Tax=Aliidongia sp. TaxID=1914230 RepID=UPI002DDCD703|nr:PhnD/SsuA/transferrin family substrate-binding protein [Aliidongia sp.]HEV2676127.1 PhnD/SsuA/transferrin family substrate-binding protein [Aliidongia sp.]
MPAALAVNARMYSVAPGAASAWCRLFGWLADAAGCRLHIVDHVFPAPLETLWARDDLAAAFMCGWPFAREGGARPIVAAPIPSSSPQGRAVYRSHFIMRADSPFATLEQTFGRRLAYTVESSHSGYNAPRHHLLGYRTADRPALYGSTVGPLIAPRRVVEAILAGEADVGPLDSYAYDLLCRHDPGLMAGVRVLDSTGWAPLPLLVGSPGGDAGAARALGLVLQGAAQDPAAQPILGDLALAGFMRPDAADYAVTVTWDAAACAAGYEIVM